MTRKRVRFFGVLFLLLTCFALAGCAGKKEAKREDITIVYTNDVHSYIDNVISDEDGNVIGDGLRFSKIAAMVNDLKEEGKEVVLVDAGDEIQGNVYGSMDEGSTIIDIMNATGYQFATPGNHEFDYGVMQFLKLAEQAEFKYLTCNFHYTESDEAIFEPYQITEIAGCKVAFIGITTPETYTSTAPVYFQNEKGEYIYEIDGTANSKDLYDSVQRTVDKARNQADYVIAIGHLGVGMDAKNKAISSEDVIANTTGIDAFIDGHSHTTIESEMIKNKDGQEILLSQTGYYLNAVGVMTITADGKISTKLVTEYDKEDAEVAKLEQKWIGDVTVSMNEKIATLESPLYICNPKKDDERWIRAMEMNSGDFVADSVYWYFNDKLLLDCDVVIANSGGIRSQVEKGDFTYMSAKQIQPFGNQICMISVTGQQLLDALEMGTTVTGVWDDEWNTPAENGGFMQVAGLTYTIDAEVESAVKTDENDLFLRVDGEYRVKDVKIYNRTSGEYEPIDLTKEYHLAGINYLLRNGGSGLSMFVNNEQVVDYVGQDCDILAEYAKSFAGDESGVVINSANSPLAKYTGYLLDYENALGAGRINIINVEYNK